MKNRIITVSREFGSGGRELGKRLAEHMGIAYYDREILAAICEKSGLAEQYVESITSSAIPSYYPIHYARSFQTGLLWQKEKSDVILLQQSVLKELAAKSDCVIVGRNADVILREVCPYNLFVYADLTSCIARCRSRDAESDNPPLSQRELQKNIKGINTARRKSRELLSEIPWGDKNAYHLCINTSNVTIKSLIPPIAQLAECYFKEKE